MKNNYYNLKEKKRKPTLPQMHKEWRKGNLDPVQKRFRDGKERV
jgi:hypothetical protein